MDSVGSVYSAGEDGLSLENKISVGRYTLLGIKTPVGRYTLLGMMGSSGDDGLTWAILDSPGSAYSTGEIGVFCTLRNLHLARGSNSVGEINPVEEMNFF